MQLTPVNIKPSRTDVLDTVAQAVETRLEKEAKDAYTVCNTVGAEISKQQQKIKAHKSTTDIKLIEKEIAAAITPILKKHGFTEFPVGIHDAVTCSLTSLGNVGDKSSESIRVDTTLRKISKPRSTTKLEGELTRIQLRLDAANQIHRKKQTTFNNFTRLSKTDRRNAVTQMVIATQHELLDAVGKLADSMVVDTDKLAEIVEKASW